MIIGSYVATGDSLICLEDKMNCLSPLSPHGYKILEISFVSIFKQTDTSSRSFLLLQLSTYLSHRSSFNCRSPVRFLLVTLSKPAESLSIIIAPTRTANKSISAFNSWDLSDENPPCSSWNRTRFSSRWDGFGFYHFLCHKSPRLWSMCFDQRQHFCHCALLQSLTWFVGAWFFWYWGNLKVKYFLPDMRLHFTLMLIW